MASSSQMKPIGAEWSQLEPSGAKWSQVEPIGAKWSQVEPSGAKWSQVAPRGAKWSQVEPSEAKWSQVGPSGAKRGQINENRAPTNHGSKMVEMNRENSMGVLVTDKQMLQKTRFRGGVVVQNPVFSCVFSCPCFQNPIFCMLFGKNLQSRRHSTGPRRDQI